MHADALNEFDGVVFDSAGMQLFEDVRQDSVDGRGARAVVNDNQHAI